MSYKEEAAEVADVPVGTIMSRLARAQVALKAKLEEIETRGWWGPRAKEDKE